MKLSHSAANRYNSCPEEYNYHYNKRLREKVKSAALLFGSALDAAFNAMLLDKQAGTPRPLDLYKSLFIKEWTAGDMNGVKTSLFDCIEIAYSANDMDFELVSLEDARSLSYPTLEALELKYDEISKEKKIKGIERINKDDALLINKVNWLCLKQKGLLMVEAYYKEILPKIKKVLAVQKKLVLHDGADNEIVCYLDAVVDFGDGPVVIDNKTSTRDYEEDSASNSHQLALYCHAIKDEIPTNKTAFVVLYKQIQKNREKTCTKCGHAPKESRAKTCDKEITGKRCHGAWNEIINPSVRHEIIHGSITEHFEIGVIENYDTILKAISNNIYYKNWSNCERPFGKCAYFYLCRSGKKDGLVQL